jgi:hypothetical protein
MNKHGETWAGLLEEGLARSSAAVSDRWLGTGEWGVVNLVEAELLVV